MTQNLSDRSMSELFRMEVATQTAVLTDGLLALERDPTSHTILQDLMRASHSLKGAARIVGRKSAAQIAHAMEDCIVAAQKQKVSLSDKRIDTMLRAVDFLTRIAEVPEEHSEAWEVGHRFEVDAMAASLTSKTDDVAEVDSKPVPAPSPRIPDREMAGASTDANSLLPTEISTPAEPAAALASERVVRVTADNLNRLLGLAGEALVTSRSFGSLSTDLLRLKRLQQALSRTYEQLGSSLAAGSMTKRSAAFLNELGEGVAGLQRSLVERMEEFERFDRQLVSLSARLYQEVLDCRMRPFSDGVQAFPRMTRDIAHSLGKIVHLRVIGESTTVDRDILERLRAPIDHLLRNAIDHGIETPEERRTLGKPEHGTVQLEARHSAGMLLITMTDDGRGVDLESVRRAVTDKKLATVEMAQKMSDAELFDFLFLPGFTLKETVSEISGRGVGLDVVQTAVKEVGGGIRVTSEKGKGTRIQLELPLTLSLIRALLVEIGGEPYAFPLTRIDKALRLAKDNIQFLEGRQIFTLGEHQIGLVAASQILELESPPPSGDTCVVVLGDRTSRYGLVVDRFLGERELVVRTLDSRLGKIRDISAAASMPDGSPLLIIDVDDLIRHIEIVISGNRLSHIAEDNTTESTKNRKRVLVVDDSLTVRELERKLLGNQGYAVDVAVDGMDGWNAVRTGNYDLVVTDVDMPRLDGIELVGLIRKDSRLRSLPVMIVSYKDRQEDRQRGLEAGADYYLTKGSFHDETLVRAVSDLLGGEES